MRELAPERRADLRHLARRRQAIEPRQQRGVQRRRDRQRRHRPRHRVVIAGVREHAALEHGLGQLLDEQRHAVGALDDLVGDLLGQRLAAGHVRDHLGALPGRQAVEREQRHVRTADPGRRELRPEGDDHQDRQRGHPLDEQVERLARGRVDPVHVLEHHQHRLTRRQSLDLRQSAREASSPCASAA